MATPPTPLTRPTTESGSPRKRTALRLHAAALMVPPKKVAPPPSVWKSIRSALLMSYLNMFLVCVPISWALGFSLPKQYALVFVFSFLAIIPLTKLRAFATGELSLRVSSTLAALMDVTLGNIVELIFAIITLTKCELDIVQSSLLGSILNNLLLVLGTCFFAGGLRFSEQGFGIVAAHINLRMLVISVIAVLLPGAFVLTLDSSSSTDKSILSISHGVSIILLFIYVSYLFFQLFSHERIYRDDSEDAPMSKKYTQNPFKMRKFCHGKQAVLPQYAETSLVASPSNWSQMRFPAVGDATQPTSDFEFNPVVISMHEEMEIPQMSVSVSLGLLVVVTAIVSVTIKLLVNSITGLTSAGTISRVFIAIILLPIVGNPTELVTNAMVSVKDKLSHSLGVAVDSSIIAFFVIPFLVTLGWILNKPLTLFFDPFQSVVLFLSVLTVNYIIHDGKSNWLKGMILMCLYLVLCVTFWYHPGTAPLLAC